MPHEGAIVAIPSHRVMQSSPDICPTTSRSKSTGNVALCLTDAQSTSLAERKANMLPMH